MGNTLMYSRYRVDLRYRVSHYNGRVNLNRMIDIIIHEKDSKWR